MDTRAVAHDALSRYRDEILQVAQDLIRIPSRNMPPIGEEGPAQAYLADYLRRAGHHVDLYEPDQAPGLLEHPAYWPGRSYKGRPNLHSRLPGAGGGRSLLLTGHIDTVALGENVWTHPPYGAEVVDGRLYGLGSIDMKAAMAAMAVLYRAIAEQGVRLKGSLSYECVVDEEEGGVNATIAGRLKYGKVDGALLPEGTDLKLYPAARGALITDFIFKSTKGTWLDVGKRAPSADGQPAADAVQQMGLFLSHIDELSAARRKHPVHPLYSAYPDPMPVQVTKVYAGGWGPEVPIAVPPEGRIEVIMQTLPGETREAVRKEMSDWLDSVVARHPHAFVTRPEIRYRLRWMVPTALAADHPVVTTLAEVARPVLGRDPEVIGAPFACDMFALHQLFDIPGIIFGPVGANAHAADEYIDLDSLYAFWEVAYAFVLEWCGTV